MPSTTPLVSVIIPTYSRPTNLVRAIDSVLNQTYPNIEIIVVDDNGEGTPYQIETKKLLEQYIKYNKIQYLAHKVNKNGSTARNTGFAHSKGEFINFLDDDDEMSSTKIASQVSALKNHHEYGACFCDTEIIRENGSRNAIHNPQTVEHAGLVLSGKCFFNTSTVLFRRDVIETLGGFDEQFRRHQDYELYVRYFRNGIMVKANDATVIKYQTSNEASENPFKAKEYLEIFLSAFNQDIQKMPNKKDIFIYQYNMNLVVFLKHKYYKEACKCYKNILKYGCPNLRMHFKYIYYIVHNLMKLN